MPVWAVGPHNAVRWSGRHTAPAALAGAAHRGATHHASAGAATLHGGAPSSAFHSRSRLEEHTHATHARHRHARMPAVLPRSPQASSHRHLEARCSSGSLTVGTPRCSPGPGSSHRRRPAAARRTASSTLAALPRAAEPEPAADSTPPQMSARRLRENSTGPLGTLADRHRAHRWCPRRRRRRQPPRANTMRCPAGHTPGSHTARTVGTGLRQSTYQSASAAAAVCSRRRLGFGPGCGTRPGRRSAGAGQRTRPRQHHAAAGPALAVAAAAAFRTARMLLGLRGVRVGRRRGGRPGAAGRGRWLPPRGLLPGARPSLSRQLPPPWRATVLGSARALTATMPGPQEL
mmetsp:Transcript_23756/g.62088  ORF Transcript_23756/g.62088 Transcript_23756/m.62088 type:complete len:346 (-) Transcript_23756:589-1626(-)